MSMMALGGGEYRAEGGAFSRPFDPFTAWPQATAVRHRGADGGQTVWELQFRQAPDPRYSSEDLRSTPGLGDAQTVGARFRPDPCAIKPPPLRGYSSETIQFIRNYGGTGDFFIVPGSNPMQVLDIRVSQSSGWRSERTSSVAYPSPDPGRLTGPVQFARKLLQTWKLHLGDAAALLGFERSERTSIDNLLNGRVALAGRDVKDRIACLLHIRSTLSALFRSEEVENEWLREPHAMLDDQVPMHLLLEGSMENLLLVREYVDAMAGR